MRGVATPIGLRRFQSLHPEGMPYAWGVNGLASLLASVLGVALAINFGFIVTTLVAGECYVAAIIHAAFGRWPERNAALAADATTPPEPVTVGAQPAGTPT